MRHYKTTLNNATEWLTRNLETHLFEMLPGSTTAIRSWYQKTGFPSWPDTKICVIVGYRQGDSYYISETYWNLRNSDLEHWRQRLSAVLNPDHPHNGPSPLEYVEPVWMMQDFLHKMCFRNKRKYFSLVVGECQEMSPPSSYLVMSPRTTIHGAPCRPFNHLNVDSWLSQLLPSVDFSRSWQMMFSVFSTYLSTPWHL